MAEGADEQGIQHIVYDDGAEADQHRCARVVERVKSRRKDFDGGIAGKADGICSQSVGGLHGVEAGELAVFENERNDRPAQNRESDRRRNAKEKNQRQSVVQRAAEFAVIGTARAARQRREHRCGDGHAEDADGKLHEAKRVVQPGHRAVDDRAASGVDDRRGEVGIHENIDLHRGGADNRRSHKAKNLAYPGIGDVEHGSITEAGTSETRPLHGKLQKAADEGAVSHARDRTESESGADQKSQKQAAQDRPDIEKRRGQGRHAEDSERV